MNIKTLEKVDGQISGPGEHEGGSAQVATADEIVGRAVVDEGATIENTVIENCPTYYYRSSLAEGAILDTRKFAHIKAIRFVPIRD